MVIDPDAGLIDGDFERLQQVIWNLLSNSIKFTPAGGLVQIQLASADSSVEVRVRDTGKGLDPNFLPFAFDRFTHADGSITRAHGGLGVGLAIVKSVVELHGGTVSALSEGEGCGATFTVSLPLTNSGQSSQQTAQVEAQSDVSSKHLPELVGLKILVVDDELDICEMISAALEQCGAKVKTATSAAVALAQVEEWTPDILIADVLMPGMDGYELVRQLRKREAQAGGKIPAVALTAMARIEDRVKVLSAGFQMHVSKPVELGELRAVVASLASVIIERK
jgi:CheY-like chemotaxis protein/anti-sigma regulatory factor (Ser/Thr protein kinase)